MDSRRVKRRRREADNRPRVWIMNMVAEDPGRPLYFPQSIRKAIRYIMNNQTVALALPRIPGMQDSDINREDDISAIGSQGGIIFIQAAAPASNSATRLLLLREKVRTLKELNARIPGVYTNILGIESNREFLDFAEAVRLSRNEIAHPNPLDVIKGDFAISGFSPDYRRYAKLLLEWDPATT